MTIWDKAKKYNAIHTYDGSRSNDSLCRTKWTSCGSFKQSDHSHRNRYVFDPMENQSSVQWAHVFGNKKVRARVRFALKIVSIHCKIDSRSQRKIRKCLRKQFVEMRSCFLGKYWLIAYKSEPNISFPFSFFVIFSRTSARNVARHRSLWFPYFTLSNWTNEWNHRDQRSAADL